MAWADMPEDQRVRMQATMESLEARIRDVHVPQADAQRAMDRLRRHMLDIHGPDMADAVDQSLNSTWRFREGLQRLEGQFRDAGGARIPSPSPSPIVQPNVPMPPASQQTVRIPADANRTIMNPADANRTVQYASHQVPPPPIIPPSVPPGVPTGPLPGSAGPSMVPMDVDLRSWATDYERRRAGKAAGRGRPFATGASEAERAVHAAGAVDHADQARAALRAARQHRVAYGRMSPYAKGTLAWESAIDRVYAPGTKAAGVGAAVAGAYVLHPMSLTVGAGLWATHKGLTTHRRYAAHKATVAATKGMGLPYAVEHVDDVARAAHRASWNAHIATRISPVGLARSGIGAGLRAAGRVGLAGARAAPTAAGAMALAGGWLAREAIGAGRTVEYAARAVLTGGLRGVPDAAEAWMPFRSLPMSDPRKFALNPRIINRIGMGVGIAAAGAFAKEMLSPKLPDPVAYFDGVAMHHMNDMGANAHYAQTLLGGNESVMQGGMRPGMAQFAPMVDDGLLMASRMILRR